MGSSFIIDRNARLWLVKFALNDDAATVLFKGTPLHSHDGSITVVLSGEREREHVTWLHANERFLSFTAEVHRSV